MSNIDRLSLDDWMRISKCVIQYADKTIDEFKKENKALFGAAGTVSNKLFELTNQLNETAHLLNRIDEVVTDIMRKGDTKNEQP